QLIKDEINTIKSRQHTATIIDDKECIFEQITFFFSKNNFDSFIQPIIYITFTLIAIIFLYAIIKNIKETSGFAKVILSAFYINLVTSLYIFIHFLHLVLEKNAKPEYYKYFILLIVIPLFLSIILLKYHIVIINTISIILFLYKSSKKKF